MKTIDNTLLNFEDIQIYADNLIDSGRAENEPPLTQKERSELILRYLHTFLEWNLLDKYVYSSVWVLNYVSIKDNSHNALTTTIKTGTQKEAKKIAIEKISRYLRTPIHFEYDDQDNLEEDLYMVVDSRGVYRGMVEIQLEKIETR